MRKTGISLSSILSIVFVMSACKEQSSHNGHEYVDLGLSVKWATCNVGAQNPEDYGEYYAWGETITKTTYTWKNYRFRVSGDTYSDLKFSKYDPAEILDHLKKTVLDLADDVANVKWGGNWRMPTKQEVEELVWNCDWVWTTQNGVNGVKITSKVEGYTDRSIFMPAAGYRDDSKLIFPEESGYLWSSTNTDMRTSAHCIHFDSHGSFLDATIRNCIDEGWYWYDEEDVDVFSKMPQSLAVKLRNYYDAGKVNLDSIPESIYSEYRTYISKQDWALVSYLDRCIGLPVRPVCP